MNTTNTNNFRYRTNSVKINDQKKPFKKPPFLAHFSNFGGKKSFSYKLGCHTKLHKGFWHYAKIQRNLIILFQENTQTDVKREGWKDPIL